MSNELKLTFTPERLAEIILKGLEAEGLVVESPVTSVQVIDVEIRLMGPKQTATDVFVFTLV